MKDLDSSKKSSGLRDVISGFLSYLRGAFTSNLGMKIGAIVFAFVLWSYVVTFNNPERVKTLYDVPVTYLGAESLHERGLTSSRPLYDALNTVNVTVKVRSEYMAGATSALVQATVDLTGITQPGEYTLPVRGSSEANFISISNTIPSNVTLQIEDSAQADVPVEVQLEGTQNPDMYYGVPRLSRATVDVSGARSAIESVGRAVCTVDVTGLDQTLTATLTPQMVSQDGDVMSSSLFAEVPNVIVEVPVYPKRTVTLDPDRLASQITGVPDGYAVSSIEVDPAEIEVAGPSDVIRAIQNLTTGPIDIDGATGRTTVTEVPLVLPDGVYAALPSSVNVTVTVTVVESTKSYAGIAVGTKNLDERLEAVLQPSAVDVEVSGAESVVSGIKASEILPFVDLSGLGAGMHNAEIKFENEADLGVQLQPSTKTIRVLLREVQEDE